MSAVRMAMRQPSVASFRLPAIQHPLSRLGDPETISLRGYSTDGAKNPKVFTEERGRPLSHEERVDSVLRSQTSKSNRAHQAEKDSRLERESVIRPPLHIPEGVEVTWAADPDKPRLPIFGQRAATANRAESFTGSCASSCRTSTTSCPAAHLRLQVDQLEYELREKVRAGGHSTLKNLFKNNDPEGQGQVNRDVLLVILTKFLGRAITFKQLKQLLLRLHLSEKTVLGFEEFCALLREPVQTGAAGSCSLVQQSHTPALQTASQVHALLRGPAHHSFLAAVESLPGKDPEGPRRIVAPELRNILEQLDLRMEDQEFQKLWKRYDVDGLGAVKLDVLLDRIGVKDRKKPKSGDQKVSVCTNADEGVQTPARTLSKSEEERKTSIAMEKWLKDKFREGFHKMKAEFEKLDPDKSGKVQPEDFLQVLRTFGLHLKREHVGLFLARCGLAVRKTGIDYGQLLRRFQDRSEEGVTHRILANPQHRFHQEENISHASTVTAAEAKLTHLFQSEYLTLLDTFRNIDKFDKKVVSQQEFRAAIESRFRLEISDPEFEQLLDRLPLDEEGNVQYLLFMAPFDTRGGAPSLFESQTERDREPTKGDLEDRGRVGQGRSDAELFAIIKTLVNKHYQAVERVFEELDEKNTRRLTQETMCQLLKRFDIHPEVSRGEIRRLWGTLITNQDKTLDFLQFARHFGHSPKSACFPNAKLCPPKRGDEDFRLRSRTLNAVSDILVDSVRAKVEFFLHELQSEFESLDPYRTGFVSQEEFKDILMRLCVHLNQYECDVLQRKFDINHDGRVSYVEFLKPFALPRQTWRHGSNMAEVLHSYRASNDTEEERSISSLGSLTTRLRKKLQGEGRTLRRSFRKLDATGSGFLSPSEFGAVLKLCNVALDQEEVYHILSRFDRGLDGRVDYRKFLQEMRQKSPKPERA